jgi:hypothetical protein
MAAKGNGKPATPKKFKQARADARPAAKAAFSGKSKAGLKDPTLKLTADDKKAISEMQKSGRADTKAGLTQADTEARAAERQRALDRFRQGESGPSSTSPKSTPVVKDAPSKPRLQGTSQAAASKPAKAPSGKAANSSPGSSQGISKVEKPETKPQTKKPSTTRTATRGASSVSKPGKSLAIRPDAVISPKERQRYQGMFADNSPKTGKEVAIRSKGTVATTSTKGGAPAVREAKVTVIPRAETAKPKFGKIKAGGKGLLGTAVAAEGLSMVKGSTDKDLKELDRLKAKLAKAQGKTYKPGFFGNFKADAAGELSQLGSLATMGLVGKTRRQYMDELNTKIAKAEAKKAAVKKPSVPVPPVGTAQGGMPGGGIAKAQSAASMATKKPQIPAGGPSGGSAAPKGSTGKTVAPGGVYTVVKGDTLWDIAKRHGVTLKQVREANPVFTENPKYKNGSMIWSGTKVRIPGK